MVKHLRVLFCSDEGYFEKLFKRCDCCNCRGMLRSGCCAIGVCIFVVVSQALDQSTGEKLW